MTSRLIVRKLMTIICESVVEAELTDAVSKLGATGYTVTDARGRGTHGVRDGSWPENANIRIEVLCDEDTASRILDLLVEIYYTNYTLVTFVSDVGVVRPNKFSAAD